MMLLLGHQQKGPETLTLRQIYTILHERYATTAPEELLVEVLELLAQLDYLPNGLEGLTKELVLEPIPQLAKSLQIRLEEMQLRTLGTAGPFIEPAEVEVVVRKVLTGKGYIFICSGHNTGLSTLGRAIECSNALKQCGVDVLYVDLEPLKTYTSESDFWEKLFDLLARHPSGERFKIDMMRELLSLSHIVPGSEVFEALCFLDPPVLLVLDGASLVGEVEESLMFDVVDAVRGIMSNYNAKCAGVVFLGVHSLLNTLSNHLRTINFVAVSDEEVSDMAGEQHNYYQSLRNRKQKPCYIRGNTLGGGVTSPLREDALLDIKKFNIDEVRSFMEQLQRRLAVTGAPARLSDESVDMAANAAYSLTSGNKGLTAACSKILEDHVLSLGTGSNLESFIRYKLPEKLSHSAAFGHINKALKYVYSHREPASVQRQSEKEILQRALIQGVAKVPLICTPVMLMQQTVLVMVDRQLRVVGNAAFRLTHDANSYYLYMISSHIVAYSLLLQLSWPSISGELFKQCNVPLQLDIDWVLQQVVEHLHMDALFPVEPIDDIQTEKLFPHAYRAQFILILNNLVKELAKLNTYKYKVVVEARNLGVGILSSQWPYILLTSDHSTPLAIRIAASNQVMREHVKHAHQLSCNGDGLVQEKGVQTVIVNFLQHGNDSQLQFPSCSSIVSVHNVVLPHRQQMDQHAKIYSSPCQYLQVVLRNPFGSGILQLNRSDD